MIFISASLLNKGLLLKKKQFAPEEQILFFESRPNFERYISYKETNSKARKLFSFVNMAEINSGAYIYLKTFSD